MFLLWPKKDLCTAVLMEIGTEAILTGPFPATWSSGKTMISACIFHFSTGISHHVCGDKASIRKLAEH